MKKRHKGDLKTLAGGVNPLEGFRAELQRRARVQIAEFLSIADRILGLMTCTRKRFGQTLAVPSAIRPIRTVAMGWKDN